MSRWEDAEAGGDVFGFPAANSSTGLAGSAGGGSYANPDSLPGGTPNPAYSTGASGSDGGQDDADDFTAAATDPFGILDGDGGHPATVHGPGGISPVGGGLPGLDWSQDTDTGLSGDVPFADNRV